MNEREAVKILNGKDPFRTVYFKNSDNSQPCALYTQRIKELFPFCSRKINVYFNNSK